MIKIIPLFLLTIIVSGCSMFPYENGSSCNMDKQYGKCIDVEGAYYESVTGQDTGAPDLYKKSEGNPKSKNDEGNVSSNHIDPEVSQQITYETYQSARYKELGNLIKEEKAPMLTPPKTVRTLIISYSPDYQRKRLYMPRYVFSIVEDSKFILGQYKKQSETLDSLFK